jgi:large repetitive protein
VTNVPEPGLPLNVVRGGSRRASAFLLPAAVLITLAGVLFPTRPATAATPNTVVLDNGTCGHDLQLGSDPTASSSATPTFLLYADGGAASYSVAIDGTAIGTFHGNDYGNACITDTLVLSNGPHVLTADELAPNPGNPVTPFSFSVDTVPPSTPSEPYLDPSTDSGVKGDDITNVTNPRLDGTSDPNVSIDIYDGTELVGGGLADSSGDWEVTVITLANGVHSLTANAMNDAGDLSALSPALLLTIDTTPPPAPPTPTLDPSSQIPPGDGDTTSVTTPTIDGAGAQAGSTINVSVDGTGVGATQANSSGSWQFTLPKLSVGSYAVTATATDVAGNTSARSATMTLVIFTGSASDPAAPALSEALGSTSVDLSWTTPADGGAAITSYNIYRGTTPGSETLLGSVGQTTVTYADAAVTKGTKYYYRVTATNNVGPSPLSNEVSGRLHRHLRPRK